MIQKISKLLNCISNGSIQKSWIEECQNKDNKQIYIINENATSLEYKPTILINGKRIVFNMHIKQGLNHLNKECCDALNDFNNLFQRYVNIYNEIQNIHYVEDVGIYIKIIYNLKTNKYNLLLKLDEYIFYTRQNRDNSTNPFYKALCTAMRLDPNTILCGELINLTYNENIMLSKVYNKFITIFNEKNIIYTSDSSRLHEVNNMFSLEDGYYTNNELFSAIQSYLNTIEIYDYNILDPNFINDNIQLQEALTLSQMIDI